MIRWKNLPGVAHDGVTNRINMNPQAINYFAIGPDGRVRTVATEHDVIRQRLISKPDNPPPSHFTLAQTVEWIAHRDSDVEPIAADQTIRRAALAKLRTCAVEGKITASGVPLSGSRRDIDAADWLDLRFTPPNGLISPGGLEFHCIMIERAAVERMWPTPSSGGGCGSRRKRGRPGAVIARVIDRMIDDVRRGYDLANAKESEMESLYDASRYTCRIARKKVLSEKD